MAKQPKSVAPTGLSIARNGTAFTLSWKLGDSDYKDGTQLVYNINGAVSSAISLGKNNPTSYTINPGYYPTYVSFSVRGNRTKYTKNKKTKNPGWSDWSMTEWRAAHTSIPTLEYKRDGANIGTFSWEHSHSDTDNAPFYQVEAQTCVVTHLGYPSDAEWGAVSVVAETGSQQITEVASGNFVRWYRVRATGVTGSAGWNSSYHSYGTPLPAILDTAVAETYGSVSRIRASWRIWYDDMNPLDTLTIQYAIDTPTDVAMTPPASGWDDAITVSPSGVSDTIVVNVEDAVGDDQVMWVRIISTHDENSNYSNVLVAQKGALVAPDINATPNATTGDVVINITEHTDCPAACTAIFFRSESDPSNDRIVAILPHGTTSTTINVPAVIGAETTCFGAYSFLGTYTGTIISNIQMRSTANIDSDIVALAPAVISASMGPVDGSVRIGWEWSWSRATIAELSWADNEYSWESTEQPTMYKVEDTYSSSWLVMGLETGKRWWFRVRLINGTEDTDVVGPWSALVSYDLASIPDKPVLNLSKTVINEGGTLTAKWAYNSTSDNDTQAYAEICEVTFSGNTPVYGTLIAYTESSQSVEISQDWATGTTHYLAVRVTSSTGTQSEWSDPVSIYVTEPVTISVTPDISDGNFAIYCRYTDTIYYTDHMTTMTGERYEMFRPGIAEATHENPFVYTTVDEEAGTETTTSVYPYGTGAAGALPTLRVMPLTVTVLGAGETGTTVLSIVRSENYHLYRPDDRDFDGYAGETIATHSQTGETPITINVSNLVGNLDDGAKYTLVAAVIDTYGQTVSEEIPFAVNWAHKADVPGAQIRADKVQRIMKITPIAPDNYEAGDTCDIYRLSADQPELIVKGAAFGTTYVDPYPAFGESGGHRLVTRTVNGDYATAIGLGWYDTGSSEGDYLDDLNMVIDVNGDQIELPYEITLNNTWGKDFQRTTYLGGSIHGDWNPAVTRDLSANTVIVRGDDLDRQLAMRDLAGYTGVAHIRTPDGSSLTADIQISEAQSYDTKKVSYTLTIKAIDTQNPVGMTLDEWNESHPIGE